MAHKQQSDFCLSVKARFPAAFTGKRVLDIGAVDVNGNNRYLFTDCEYIGLDCAAGPNVDVVTPCHLYNAPDGSFDTIISTEAFEHDLHVYASLQKIVKLLRRGGLFLFTAATTGRAEHGTIRSGREADAPGIPWQYYRNVTEDDVRWAIQDMSIFSDYAFSIGHETCDIYFYGVKK